MAYFQTAPNSCVWPAAVHQGLALLLLLTLLAHTDAAERFHQHGWPALRERRRQAAVRDARLAVESYWQAHRSQVEGVVPEQLYRSRLQAAIPDDSEPAVAWAAGRDLIEHFRGIIAGEVLRQEERLRQSSAPDPAEVEEMARQAALGTVRGVVADLKMGLPPDVIARALEKKFDGDVPQVGTRHLTEDDFNRT